MAMIYPLRTFFPPLKKITLSPGIRLKHRSFVLEGASVEKSLTGLTSRDQKCFLFNSIRGVCGSLILSLNLHSRSFLINIFPTENENFL